MIKLFDGILKINKNDNVLDRLEIFISYLKNLTGSETVYIRSKYADKWRKLSDVDTNITELKKYQTIYLRINLIKDENEVNFSKSLGVEIHILDNPNEIYIKNKDNVIHSKYIDLFNKFINTGIIDDYVILK